MKRYMKMKVLLVLASFVVTACGQSEADNAGSEGQRTSETATAESSPVDGSSPTADAKDDQPSGSAIVVRVKNGKVQMPDDVVELSLGEPVRLEITSDTADEVHVHGYERKAEVAPGQKVVLEFNADIPGTFEVEFEDAGLKLFELQVR